MVNKKIISLILIFLFTFFYVSPCFGFSETYTWSTLDNSIETSSSLPSSDEVLDNNSLNLEAGSAILIEQNSGQILYGYNIHERLYPASVTKIMSLLLIMEALDSGKITLDTAATNAFAQYVDTNQGKYAFRVLKRPDAVGSE